jgi:predicted DNA-binding protein
MARMVRKQIVMGVEQEQALEERAKALGVSQSALIREAVDSMLKGGRDAAHRRQAWADLRSGMREAAASGVGSRGRAWSREELHDR